MSASSRSNPSLHAAPASSIEPRARSLAIPRIGLLRWSGYAWGAIGATLTYIGLTCWWLTQDRSIPIYDAGTHLQTAFEYRSLLQSGDLSGLFTFQDIYPGLAHLVGGAAALIGGVSVAAPIIGENLVFVPLLALGCYQTGRLLFGRLAGLLAVLFVLGSPLLMSMFHVFMLDAPMAAMVALALWPLLASEDFKRVGVSALAGLAVGLSVNVKVQSALFLIGLTVIIFLHGGWRNWRGFAVFTVVALAIGTPWYIEHSSLLKYMLEISGNGQAAAVNTPEGNIPPVVSVKNLGWYFWSIMNSQLLLPLFLLAAGGILWMCVDVARNRKAHPARLEFLAGGFLAWFMITFGTAHHDMRYGLPMVGYLAVAGTGWIVTLPRVARTAAIVLLVLGVSANTLGRTIGVGHDVKLSLLSRLPTTQQYPDRIYFYTTTGFLTAAPSRDGDLPGLLKELRREGVSSVAWSFAQSQLQDFSFEGVKPLVQIAGLTPILTEGLQYGSTPSVVTLVHAPVTARTPPVCVRLRNHTAVWVVRFDEAAGKLAMYCPTRRPQYYAIGAVK